MSEQITYFTRLFEFGLMIRGLVVRDLSKRGIPYIPLDQRPKFNEGPVAIALVEFSSFTESLSQNFMRNFENCHWFDIMTEISNHLINRLDSIWMELLAETSLTRWHQLFSSQLRSTISKNAVRLSLME